MKPVVIYRAPDEKRAIFCERFAATPFYGSDVSGEEARKHIIRARPLSAPLICSPPRKTSRSRKTWRCCRASPIKPVSKHGQPTNYLTSPFKKRPSPKQSGKAVQIQLMFCSRTSSCRLPCAKRSKTG